ncbi:MAG: hypothetical protein H6706_13695 [Myxococcales bacterium]|nr:hypothetical protein [Myxococcales bacterium]
MDDRLDRARREGDGPRAPALVGLLTVAGGVLGAATGAAFTPWRALAAAGFGLDAAALDALPGAIGPTVGLGALGALFGAAAAHLLVDRPTPALRLRVRRGGGPRTLGLAALLIAAVVLAVLPALLQQAGGRDPGRLLVTLPLLALGLAVTLGVPLAAWDRARGRARWRERVAPDPPPRRPPDAASPEVRAALGALARADLPLGDAVVWAGDLACAVSLDPPRLLRHGGRALVAEAEAAGVPVIEAPALGAPLAGVPTGDPLPPALALAIAARRPPAP